MGTRPAGLVRHLDRFPHVGTSSDPFERALELSVALTNAVLELGDGPVGRAAQALFGVTAETRGRLLKDRRRIAATELGVLASTFRKYYERDILSDVAVQLWQHTVSS